MIEVILRGGLGNCLFLYAAGRALAFRHQTRLQLNISRYISGTEPRGLNVLRALKLFNIDAEFTTVGYRRKQILECLRLREHRQLFDELGWGFNPAFLKLEDKTLLTGYFQSRKYWAGIEALLRKELVPRRLSADRPFREILDAIKRVNAVSLHVRRRDYLSSPMHNVCNVAYFERAVRAVRSMIKTPVFFIFSDDPAWCRESFTGPGMVMVALPPKWYAPVLDLYLMSQCRHNIISNSTFSWWGAWMNCNPEKIVLTPDRWFNDEAMDMLAMRDTVPPEWQRLRTGSDGSESARHAAIPA